MQDLLTALVERWLLPVLGVAVLVAGLFSPLASRAWAAEILSVREPAVLRIGDQNRSYLVQLACLDISDTQSPEALEWMRSHGSRGTKVNIRPLAQEDGMLVARVSVLKTGVDLGEALLAKGLATPSACPDQGEGQ